MACSDGVTHLICNQVHAGNFQQTGGLPRSRNPEKKASDADRSVDKRAIAPPNGPAVEAYMLRVSSCIKLLEVFCAHC